MPTAIAFDREDELSGNPSLNTATDRKVVRNQ